MRKLRWQLAQFFERIWWNNYLENKTPHEYLLWKTAYWKSFLDNLNIDQASIAEPIMDVGCGPAGIFTIFQDKNITALDPLINEYQNLSIFNQSDYPQVNFINKSFEDYNGKESYQTVFCLNAVNHFIDLKGSFKRLNHFTAKNGHLVVSIDAHNYSLFRYLFAWIPFDILHPHQYTLDEYMDFMKDNGFKIEQKVRIKKAFFFDYWVLVAHKPLRFQPD